MNWTHLFAMSLSRRRAYLERGTCHGLRFCERNGAERRHTQRKRKEWSLQRGAGPSLTRRNEGCGKGERRKHGDGDSSAGGRAGQRT